jgi:hypothetical protein
MLRKCILRPDLVGGIGFCGQDLGLPEIPVYHEECMPDLFTLGPRTGEDDLFTRGMAGPVFHAGEKLLRYLKVSRLGHMQYQSMRLKITRSRYPLMPKTLI